MDKKELIISTAKELLMKAMEDKNFKLNLQSSDAAIKELGDKFKTLVDKVSEALSSIDR